MNHKTHLAIASALVVLVSGITYLILDAIYQLPPANSAEAVPIDQLFRGHFILISFLFALVVVFMGYSLVVFRRRPGDDSDGEFIHGSNSLEVAWTVIPLFLVVGFGVWGWNVLDEITVAKPNEIVVEVTGQKWQWSFHYPELGEYANTPDLVVPVNTTIRLEMESRDVLHSFWVPEFRVKKDLLPGQKTTLRITPTDEGEYKIRCAEICGQRHAYMLADVRVLSAPEYASWESEILAIASLPPAEQGQRLWQANCSSCHSLDGTALVGPTWQGIYGRQEALTDGSSVTVDDEYIRESIYEPNVKIVAGFQPNLMPQNYDTILSDQDVTNIIEFMKTLAQP